MMRLDASVVQQGPTDLHLHRNTYSDGRDGFEDADNHLEHTTPAMSSPLRLMTTITTRNKRTRSVSPERTAKRPHLYLSRKLSQSSPTHDAPIASPPSSAPAFPSLLTVASSLASSLRASSSSSSNCYASSKVPPELPQPALAQGSNYTQRASCPFDPTLAVYPSPSSMRPCAGQSKRLGHTMHVSSMASSAQSAQPPLHLRPSSSRNSSSDSYYADIHSRTFRLQARESSEPISEASSSGGHIVPSGLVMPADDEMEEDSCMTAQPTTPLSDTFPTSEDYNNTPPVKQHSTSSDQPLLSHSMSTPSPSHQQRSSNQDDMDMSITPPSSTTVKANALLSPGQRAVMNTAHKGRIRYSMGFKRGCEKCERGDKGHFTHIEYD